EQTGGRAGRGEKKGKVFIQTYNSDNPVMQALAKGNKEMFLENEIKARQTLNMPPFGNLASLIISGKDKNVLNNYCNNLARTAFNDEKVKTYGPSIAPISYLNGKYRVRFLLQSQKDIRLQNIISKWLKTVKIPSSVSVKLDIDPYSFM
ncbi:MAG: primosomal protein N', partial [Rickettsiales bacterium]|nr:primosomal protein N' [Rickettsiales bacterium]